MSSSCKKSAVSKLVTTSLALQESALVQCFPGTASQSCLLLCAVLPTSKSAEVFISLPAFYHSTPLCQSCGFHLCFPSHSLGPVMCPLPPLTLGVFGCSFSMSSLNTSRGGPRLAALHKGMCLPWSPWAPGSLSPAFLFLNQVSVSVNLFTFCSTTGWTA